MSEVDVIQKSDMPITKERIVYDLRKAGIYENDVLLVHSSMSSLGFVVGREVTVIDALLEGVMSGTLVMPSHTTDNSNPESWGNPPVPEEWFVAIKENMPSFDRKKSSTRGMGKIVECFRNYKGVKRSNHPSTSFIAKGPAARYITRNHHLTPGLGVHSPLGKLYAINAKCLLLGVDFDSATVFHLAEVMSETVKEIDYETCFKNQWIKYKDYDYNSDLDFIDLGKALLKEGIAEEVLIGNAKSYLFPIHSAVNFAVEYFKEHRIKKKDA